MTAVFSADRVTKTSVTYSDTACATPSLTAVTVTTFSGGGDSEVAGAKKIDETLVSGTIKASTQDMVDYFNAQKFCGVENWALNVETSLIGLKCDDEDKAYAVGDKAYGIYKIDGTNLTFSKEDGEFKGKTEATREKVLETEEVFKKQ